MSHVCHVNCNVLLYFYGQMFLNPSGLKLELMFIRLYWVCPLKVGRFYRHRLCFCWKLTSQRSFLSLLADVYVN